MPASVLYCRSRDSESYRGKAIIEAWLAADKMCVAYLKYNSLSDQYTIDSISRFRLVKVLKRARSVITFAFSVKSFKACQI